MNGGMTGWSEIRCQRGHTTHHTRDITVSIGGPTSYSDYTPIPRRLSREFAMRVWDTDQHPVDSGVYCPAHDAVSETLLSHGVWEPRETTLALQVCSTARPEQWVVDIGAQLGWFSLLGLSCGLRVHAIDADTDNLEVLLASAEANGWLGLLTTTATRIGPTSQPLPARSVRFAKLDIEGAEHDAIAMLWPSLEAGLVDHLLVEISPVFRDDYPELIRTLIDVGYRAYVLPPKQQPPVDLDDPATALEPYRLDTRADWPAVVRSWHQEDCWFVREGATW